MRAIPLPWMVVVLAFSPTAMALAPKTSELQGGRWVEVETARPEPQVDPALVRVEQLVRDGRNSKARDAAIEWLKANKESPLRDRALYLTAEALYQYGDRVKSYYYLDELLDTYPESALYYQALEKQFLIADAYLGGYKRRLMRIPLLSAREEGVEMLYRIQQRSPGSPLAERALLRTADFYYADAQYDLAEDAYAAYVRSYPRSPAVPRVRLRQAYSNLAQFRGLRFDATPVIDAKAQLQDIVVSYPDLAQQENIAQVLEQIDATFARKLDYTADFYRRTHEPRASEYTYEVLARSYPNTPEAAHAQQALAKLGATTRPATE